MTWVTPATGLIIGAIAIPLLLLLYFLRLRRQSLRISSTMLWESAVEDLHANSPFQRLRPSLLLILQLLALLLFIFALMQPQIEGGSPRAGRHVILIDRSGSMSSFDVDDVSRLDEAKRQAIDLVNTLHGGGMFAGSGGETMVIAFADHAEIVIPFTDSQQQLKTAIQSIPPTHGRSSIEEALKLARAYTTNVDPEQEGLSASESAQLELFSDGQIFDIRKQALQRGETLRYYAIGSEESNNVGISTIAAKRPSESSEDVQVFLSLVNTGSEEVKTDVEISIDGIPIGIQQLVVPSSTDGKVGTISVVFVPFSMPRSGVVQATINSHDPLLIDDKASLVIPPPKKLSVLVTEDGVSILRTVLEGMLLAELRQVDEGTLQKMITSGEASNYDVVVTRDVRLDELKQGRYLVFGAPPPVDAFANFVKGDGQVMLVAKEDHPVMKFVRFEDIVVTEGYHVVTGTNVETLLEGSGWPAVQSYRGNGIHIVYVAFDPMNSNWPYLRSFPFFVFNSVQFLGRSGDPLTEMAREIGQSITHVVDLGTKTVVFEEPDGRKHVVDVDSNGLVSWGPIRLSGLHYVSWGDENRRVVAINCPNEESMISSVKNISIGAKTIESSDRGGRSFVQLWPWALGAVLLVLLVEWWVYQQKVGGSGRGKTVVFSIANGLGSKGKL